MAADQYSNTQLPNNTGFVYHLDRLFIILMTDGPNGRADTLLYFKLIFAIFFVHLERSAFFRATNAKSPTFTKVLLLLNKTKEETNKSIGLVVSLCCLPVQLLAFSLLACQ